MLLWTSIKKWNNLMVNQFMTKQID